MSEFPPQSPIPNTVPVPVPEHFARYANLRAGREKAAAELGHDLTLPPEQQAEVNSPYGIEAAIESGDLGALHMAIGELLVDVGQKTGDKGLIIDAQEKFNYIPPPAGAVAGEYARIQKQLKGTESDDGEEDDDEDEEGERGSDQKKN